jgi:membrane protein
MKLDELWQLVKDAVSAWLDDFAPSMGAALAYYTVFSIAPLLLLLIAVAGFFFGADAARGQIVGELSGLMGKEGAAAIEGLLKSVSRPADNLIATAISVVTLVIGATTVFAELQSDLDRIWKTPTAKKASGIWGLLRTRFLSFGMIMGVGFLLVVSLALSAGLAALGTWWSPLFGGWAILLQIINFVVSFAVITAVFAMVYKVMPSAQIRWHDVWIGALVTAFLFTVGKYLIGLYIGKAGVSSAFGAAGSLIVVLVWVYYSTQIFLLGAEFTQVYAKFAGSHAGIVQRSAAEIPRASDAVVTPPDFPTPHGQPANSAADSHLSAPIKTAHPELKAGKSGVPVPLTKVAVRLTAALAAGWVAGYLLKPEIRHNIAEWARRTARRW